MELKNFTFEEQGALGILTVNRPAQLNSLSAGVLAELEAFVEKLEAEKKVRALIITGAGKAFVAGADIAQMSEMTQAQAYDFAKIGHRVFSKLEAMRCVTIAAVNGYALGGGMELAMSCDIRISSDKARFGQPEVGLGITPGFGGTQRLARLCGPALAKDLVFSGRMIKAEEAAAAGLVSRVVPVDTLLAEAKKTAEEILSKSFNAVMSAKQAIDRGLELSKKEGLALEERIFSECFAHADQKEGMKAFLGQKKPNFA